jgi:hypothetical protein
MFGYGEIIFIVEDKKEEKSIVVATIGDQKREE